MPRAPHLAALAHVLFAAEQDTAHDVLLERERETERAVLELDDLLAAHIAQPSHRHYAIADAHDGPGVEHLLDSRSRSCRGQDLA